MDPLIVVSKPRRRGMLVVMGEFERDLDTLLGKLSEDADEQIMKIKV